MRVKNHKDFACMDYNQNESCKDFRKLGQIVYRNEDDNDVEEIGVIIQVHDNDEFRTDMFGNCCSDEIRLATVSEIKRIRHNLN
jgi:hypothetical protein